MSNAANTRTTLYRKIAAVSAAMGRVPKNGYNSFFKYQYVQETDLVDAIRKLLHENGLAFLPPNVVSYETIETGDKAGNITRVRIDFSLACTDTGETITSTMYADGQDKADKGFYKAYTGAVKYFLMKTFLVATGDDPEQEDPHPQPQKPAASEQDKRAAGVQFVNKIINQSQDPEEMISAIQSRYHVAVADMSTDQLRDCAKWLKQQSNSISKE